MSKENPDPEPGATKQKHPAVFVTPITMKVARVTLWTHHTQLKETIENNDRWVITRSSNPSKTRLIWALELWLSYFVFFCLPVGKNSNPHKPEPWMEI